MLIVPVPEDLRDVGLLVSSSPPTVRANGDPLVDGVDFWANPSAGVLSWRLNGAWEQLALVGGEPSVVAQATLAPSWSLSVAIEAAAGVQDTVHADAVLAPSWSWAAAVSAAAEVDSTNAAITLAPAWSWGAAIDAAGAVADAVSADAVLTPAWTWAAAIDGAATVASGGGVEVVDTASNSVNGTGTMTLTASGAPSAGHIEVVFLAGAQVGFTMPAGWTPLSAIDLDNLEHVEVWWRVCTGSEGATIDVGVATGQTATGVMARLAGADAVTGSVGVVDGSGTSPTATAPAWPVGADDSLVLRGYAMVNEEVGWSTPAGLDTVDSAIGTGGDGTTLAVFSESVSAGVASSQNADLSATPSGSGNFRTGITVVAQPTGSSEGLVGHTQILSQGTFPVPVPLPPNVEDGDLLVMAVVTRNAETPGTPPAGWTERQRTGVTSSGFTAVGSTNEQAALYTKVASSEGSTVSYAATDDGTDGFSADVFAIRGMTTVDDTDLGNGGVAPSVDGTNGGVLVCWWGSSLSDVGTPPAGMYPTYRPDDDAAGTRSRGAVEPLTSTGATGTRSSGTDPSFDVAFSITVS